MQAEKPFLRQRDASNILQQDNEYVQRKCEDGEVGRGRGEKKEGINQNNTHVHLRNITMRSTCSNCGLLRVWSLMIRCWSSAWVAVICSRASACWTSCRLYKLEERKYERGNKTWEREEREKKERGREMREKGETGEKVQRYQNQNSTNSNTSNNCGRLTPWKATEDRI